MGGVKRYDSMGSIVNAFTQVVGKGEGTMGCLLSTC